MSDGIQERTWLHEQRTHITDYFQTEGITPPRNLQVAFSLPTKLALWSETLPDGSRQLWVITGDCPTDYLVFDAALEAREAMGQFAAHWLDVSSVMKQGRQHPTTRIGDPDNPKQLQELGAMLESRARLLRSFAQRDEIWEPNPPLQRTGAASVLSRIRKWLGRGPGH